MYGNTQITILPFLPMLWICENLDWSDIILHLEKEFQAKWVTDPFFPHFDSYTKYHFVQNISINIAKFPYVWTKV